MRRAGERGPPPVRRRPREHRLRRLRRLATAPPPESHGPAARSAPSKSPPKARSITHSPVRRLAAPQRTRAVRPGRWYDGARWRLSTAHGCSARLGDASGLRRLCSGCGPSDPRSIDERLKAARASSASCSPPHFPKVLDEALQTRAGFRGWGGPPGRLRRSMDSGNAWGISRA